MKCVRGVAGKVRKPKARVEAGPRLAAASYHAAAEPDAACGPSEDVDSVAAVSVVTREPSAIDEPPVAEVREPVESLPSTPMEVYLRLLRSMS